MSAHTRDGNILGAVIAAALLLWAVWAIASSVARDRYCATHPFAVECQPPTGGGPQPAPVERYR